MTGESPQVESDGHTMKIPGLVKWRTFAGGTSGGGKTSYEFRTSTRTYSISPTTSRHGRFAGYVLTVWPGEHGHGWITPDGQHHSYPAPGSMYRDPRSAVRSAQAHAALHG